MKKPQQNALGALVVLGVIIYPFVWLFEQLGPGGFALLACLLVAGLVYLIVRRAGKDNERFGDLVLSVLNNRLSPDEAKRINARLSRENFPRAALVREVEILRDSIDISLASKKRETAESRNVEVKTRLAAIKRDHAALIAPEILSEIERVVSQYEDRFNTLLYQSVASAYVEKAKTLKTAKSQAKYIGLAMETVAEGLRNPKSDKSVLQRMKHEIDALAQAQVPSG